ncbi:hypothetical protein IXO390_19390, partial [Xanthomonas oryzae pv. oryzae]
MHDVALSLLLGSYTHLTPPTQRIALYGVKSAGDRVKQASPWLCTVPEQGASPGPWLAALFRL